jgi:hypothetical protein
VGREPYDGSSQNRKQKEESRKMKIVTLCSSGSCCPVLKIGETQVEIGEEGNLCVLTMEQWQTLKDKVVKSEV